MSTNDDILKLYLQVRAFSFSLTKDEDAANDLTQDTMIRALRFSKSFRVGSNLKAWLFRIARNQFFSIRRKYRRETDWHDIGIIENLLATSSSQEDSIAWKEMLTAIAELPLDHQDVICKIALQGMSYEEVAQISGVPVGTIKSRINRARHSLEIRLNSGTFLRPHRDS